MKHLAVMVWLIFLSAAYSHGEETLPGYRCKTEGYGGFYTEGESHRLAPFSDAPDFRIEPLGQVLDRLETDSDRIDLALKFALKAPSVNFRELLELEGTDSEVLSLVMERLRLADPYRRLVYSLRTTEDDPRGQVNYAVCTTTGSMIDCQDMGFWSFRGSFRTGRFVVAATGRYLMGHSDFMPTGVGTCTPYYD